LNHLNHFAEKPGFFRATRSTRLFAKLFFNRRRTMLRLALIFLILALIAGALGASNAAFVSSQIAWILFVVFLVLFVVSLVFGRGSWGGSPPV